MFSVSHEEAHYASFPPIIDEIDSSLGYGGDYKGYHFFFVIHNWSGDIL